ncbi:MAG TPA: ABC transporter ATP-binding protein [archaeon]|nr:ABC transporter ATP-binding protein [archaeon]
MLVISSFIILVPPFLLAVAVDEFIPLNNLTGIGILCLVLIGVGITGAFVSYLLKYWTDYIGRVIIREIRLELFIHVNRFSFGFFDETRTGDIISRIISDSQQVMNFLTNSLINLLRNVVLLIGILLIMITWNIYFFLIVLLLFPLILINLYLYVKKVTPSNRLTMEINSKLTSATHNTLGGLREVKLYAREEYVGDIFNKLNQEYYDAVKISTKYQAFYQPFIPLIVSLSTSLIILFGGLAIINGSFSIGILIASLGYFAMLTKPLSSITTFVSAANLAKIATKRIFAILDKVPKISDSAEAIELKKLDGKIEYKNVNFHYNEKNKILSNINLTIKPGEVVAFVGPSGVGKTTMLHLLPRFYDVVDGEICIDDINIKHIKLNSLRKKVGISMQDIFLFDGSIRENIVFGREDATIEQIQNAARIAQLDEFISSLPDNYDTIIGERGVKLSGGQAQRLTLARVLVTDPKILILDEPTANVDAATDERLINAVKRAMKGRSTLIIAHRLWTIYHADKIVVLRDGNIEAIGTHDDLIQNSSFYQEFFATQFSRNIGNIQKKSDKDLQGTENNRRAI